MRPKVDVHLVHQSVLHLFEVRVDIVFSCLDKISVPRASKKPSSHQRSNELAWRKVSLRVKGRIKLEILFHDLNRGGIVPPKLLSLRTGLSPNLGLRLCFDLSFALRDCLNWSFGLHLIECLGSHSDYLIISDLFEVRLNLQNFQFARRLYCWFQRSLLSSGVLLLDNNFNF